MPVLELRDALTDRLDLPLCRHNTWPTVGKLALLGVLTPADQLQ